MPNTPEKLAPQLDAETIDELQSIAMMLREGLDKYDCADFATANVTQMVKGKPTLTFKIPCREAETATITITLSQQPIQPDVR